MKPDTGLARQLAEHGLKATPQRLVTWRVLVESPPHSSIHELYEYVAEQLPTTTLRTVYEVVHLYEHMGLVRLLHVPGGARVELEPVKHAHGYCERCGTIVNLVPAERRQLVTEKGEPFLAPVEANVAFGLCASCSQAEVPRDR